MKLTPLFLASSLVLTACTHWSSSNLKSDWNVLADADSLKCQDLPIKKEDLRIERVHVIPDLGPSLVLEVTSRRGVRGLYHLPFASLGRMNEEALVPLAINQESTFLGAGIHKEKAIFFLLTRDKGKAVVQVRDLTNNVVLTQFSIDAVQRWELGDWTFSDGVLRALVRENIDNEAIDDQPYLQLEVNMLATVNGKVRAEPSRRVIGQASLLRDKQKALHMIWLDRGTSDKVKAEANFNILSWRAGAQATPISLEEDKGRIESWAFSEADDHVTLATIKGDSLLWENAAIDVVRLSKVIPFNKELRATVPLARIHVAQPLLTQGKKGEFMLLPQWLDHELTVALYKLVDQSAQPKGYAGVFPEGTSFHKAFYHEPSEAYYLLNRAPNSALGRFSLCNLGL